MTAATSARKPAKGRSDNSSNASKGSATAAGSPLGNDGASVKRKPPTKVAPTGSEERDISTAGTRGSTPGSRRNKPQVDEHAESFLNAYMDKQQADKPQDRIPPRKKKWPGYKFRKCIGCAHVDIEVAIVEGDLWALKRTVGRLARRSPMEINQYYQDGTTPLILAIKERREDLVDALLACRVTNVDLPDKHTMLYPIHMALIYGMNLTAKRMIQKDHIDIEVRDPRGVTPVMLAAMLARDQAFNLLVEKGADLRAVDQEGFTVLICAACGGSVKICNFLLHAGADKHAMCKRRHNAYDWAMFRGNGRAAAAIADFKDVVDDYTPELARKMAAKRRL